MKLIQAKLRGTGPLIQSGWFQLSSGLNQFYFGNRTEGTIFLRALQALHPLYSCSKTLPFKSLPHFEKQGSYTRHIQPSKRTITLGVFAATAGIVGELGALDHNLYETDRIEIGRRFDYSRWMNFVELSSSSRWKDVKNIFSELTRQVTVPNQQVLDEVQNVTSALKGSDRIKGKLAERLLFFLQHADKSSKDLEIYHETVRRIKRAEHFQAAREKVIERLPLLVYFNSHGSISPPTLTPLHEEQKNHNELCQYMKRTGIKEPTFRGKNVLERIDSGIEGAISLSKSLGRLPPIFLFDTLETSVKQAEQRCLQKNIISIARSHQCFYLCGNPDFFSAEEARKNYTAEDLQKLLSSPQRADRRNKKRGDSPRSIT